MNQGKLSLREVGAKSVEMTFNQDSEWVLQALKTAAPHEDLSAMTPEEWARCSKIEGSLRVERLDPEYSVQGNFEARVPLLCPRCGEAGTVSRSGEFRLFLKPLGPRESADEGDDPDYIFLETPFIDLVQLLGEQIVAAEGVVEYPDQDMVGKAHVCEPVPEVILADSIDPADSDLSSRQSNGKARKSPFEVLKNLKK
jgi:uncharacterized metal-binding protein YceD (DUF177 family)